MIVSRRPDILRKIEEDESLLRSLRGALST